jgi:dihydropteroate synthase
MSLWRARGTTFADPTRPRVMGIVNVTPDSFSDGGRSLAFDDAIATAERLVAEGADLLDIGGESSRPGAEVVAEDEEIDRVVPVVRALVQRVAVPISVDTTKPRVARLALEAGASIVNDIRGLDDPDLLALAAETGAGVVLMHMQGTPLTMQVDPHYDDVVREVLDDLKRKVERAERAGIAVERIAVDPGIGFGKTFEHNLQLLRNLEAFASVGCVLLVGTSRKGFLGKLAGRRSGDQTIPSVTSALAAAAAGARVVRVHDVGPTAEAFRVWEGHRGWDRPSTKS